MKLLTLYTWPKSFNDPHIATIQRNAARSWVRMDPLPNVLIFGDEPGVTEYCTEFGFTRVPEAMEVIDGTVRLRDIAEKAETVSDTPFYCFINADIILTSNFVKAMSAVSARFPRFLLGASPWNVEIKEDLRFEPRWEEELIERARAANDLRPRACSDFFLYPRGYLSGSPELLVGRAYIDNGLMWQTRKRGDPLVDGTTGVFAIHQNHHYHHFGDKADRKQDTEGALWNVRAIGGPGRLYTWANATHHYTPDGIRNYWAGRFTRWSTHFVSGSGTANRFHHLVWRRVAKWTRPIRSAIGLVNPR